MERPASTSILAQVDNSIYDHLGEQWYSACDNPVALLRAESKIKTPWIQERIQKSFGETASCQILDIGCGAGFLSNALASQGHTVTGVDLSEESLNVAQKYDATKTVSYQKADAYQLPFADGSFQVVTAMDFLEHVEEPARVIQEASRVLQPGGLFFFHTFNRNWLSGLVVIKAVEWFVKNTPKNLHLLRLFITPKEMQAYCDRAKMEAQEIVGLRPNIGARHLPYFVKREVPLDFSFSLTSSLRISYLGYSKKNDDQKKEEESPWGDSSLALK